MNGARVLRPVDPPTLCSADDVMLFVRHADLMMAIDVLRMSVRIIEDRVKELGHELGMVVGK